MKDEIKEILEKLKSKKDRYEMCIRTDISFSDDSYEAHLLLDYITNLQEENERLLYYKKIIDRIIIIKDYPYKEDSYYILCNMSKQELYKLLCEARKRIYKEVGKDE